MKKTIAMIAALSTINAFAYSEAKVLTKMSAEGEVAGATSKAALIAVISGAVIEAPVIGGLALLSITNGGPGFSADLDAILYSEYGILHTAVRGLDYSLQGSGKLTQVSAPATESVKNAIVKTAQKIVGESDTYYAEGELGPEKTPELYRNAKHLSEHSGMGMDESAEEVIYTAEEIASQNE